MCSCPTLNTDPRMKLIKKEKIFSRVDLSYDKYIMFSSSVLCIIYARHYHYISKFNKVKLEFTLVRFTL